MATRDAATVSTIGDINPPPAVATPIGAQGSSRAGLRARPVIVCGQFASSDAAEPGAFVLAKASGA